MDKIINYLQFELEEQKENYDILVKVGLEAMAQCEAHDIRLLKDLIASAKNDTPKQFVVKFLDYRNQFSFNTILQWYPARSCLEVVTKNKDLACSPVYVQMLDSIKE